MPVINDFQVSGLFPSVVSANVNTAQYFPRLLGTSIGVQSVAPSSTSAAGQLVLPGNSELLGQWFDVLVGATALDGSGDPSATFQLELVVNTGTVSSPSYTSIATATTAAPNTNVSQEIGLKVSLFCGASKKLQGLYTGTKDGVIVTAAAISSSVAGVDMTLASPAGLAVRATFSTANASNVAKLTQFQISAA